MRRASQTALGRHHMCALVAAVGCLQLNAWVFCLWCVCASVVCLYAQEELTSCRLHRVLVADRRSTPTESALLVILLFCVVIGKPQLITMIVCLSVAVVVVAIAGSCAAQAYELSAVYASHHYGHTAGGMAASHTGCYARRAFIRDLTLCA